MNKIEQSIIYGWYLREDFNPEPIQSLIDRSFKPSFIEEMKEAGNLFKTREEADTASWRVKEILTSKSYKFP